MSKNRVKKTIKLNAVYIRSSVNSDLYSVYGEPEWFGKGEHTFDSKSNEIEIDLKLAKKRFPNENF